MLRRSGRSLHRDRAQRSRPPLRQQHRRRRPPHPPCAAARPGSADLPRHPAPAAGAGSRSLQKVLNIQKLPLPDHRHHSLVRPSCPPAASELLAPRSAPATDAARHSAIISVSLQRRLVLPLPGHTHMVESPASRAQSLLHRVQTVHNFHFLSLSLRRAEFRLIMEEFK